MLRPFRDMPRSTYHFHSPLTAVGMGIGGWGVGNGGWSVGLKIVFVLTHTYI